MLSRNKKAPAEVKQVQSRSPLALSLVDGHIVYTGEAAWAWFEVPTQRWAFAADEVRLGMVIDMATRVVALQGHELHVRVTSQPLDVARWSSRLGGPLTPNPLPGYAEHLACVSDHLAKGAGSLKRVYIGVRLASRKGNPVTAMADKVMGRPSHALEHKVAREAAIVAEGLAGQGMEATPAAPEAMEWLLRRSIELGMPTPQELSPTDGEGRWDAGDLHELDEGVYHESDPFGDAVKVVGRGHLAGVARYVSVLTVGRIDAIEVPDPSRAPWLSELDKLPFAAEWSLRLRVLSGEEAKDAVGRSLLVIRDMQKHYAEHDLDEPLQLERQVQQAREVDDEMSTGAETVAARIHGWYRVAVWSDDVPYEQGMDEKALAEADQRAREQVRERARMVIDTYRKRQVTIAHPKGQYGLLREFIPGEPLSSTAYQRRTPALYLAAGVPQAASTLGDQRGPVIGHTVGMGRRSVMFDTHFATEVRETAGLVPIMGGLGSGKSVLAGLITYEAVRRGITSIMLDPSGPLARLTELPEFEGRARHIDLTAAAPGSLSPFGVVPDPRPDSYGSLEELEEARTLAALDRKQLALDVAVMLLPAQMATVGRVRTLLTSAVRETRGSLRASLWTVVESLEKFGDPLAKEIADYLRDMAEMPLARLFFPPAGDVVGPMLDATLTVITMPGLVLPPRTVAREHWSTSEQLAVPLLHLASWYATRTIYGRPRNERKLVALDETHFLGEWGAGRALFNRLGRDSRKWNTCVLAASQNPADVLGMEVSNFISAAFVGRIQDEGVAREALRMLKVPAGVGYEEALGRLSPRAAGGQRSGLREFVMRDVDGNVDRMRVDLDHLPHVLAALDTTASPATMTTGPEVRTLSLDVA